MYEQNKLSYLNTIRIGCMKLEALASANGSGENPASVFFPSHACEDLSDTAMLMDGPEVGNVSSNSFDVSRLNTHACRISQAAVIDRVSKLPAAMKFRPVRDMTRCRSFSADSIGTRVALRLQRQPPGT